MDWKLGILYAPLESEDQDSACCHSFERKIELPNFTKPLSLAGTSKEQQLASAVATLPFFV